MNGSLLALAKDSLQIWNKKSKKMDDIPIMLNKPILNLVELPGGFLAAGTDEGEILILDIVKACIVKTFQAHSCSSLVWKISSTNSLISFSRMEQSIKIWQIGLNFEMKLLATIICEKGLVVMATLKDSIVTFHNSIDGHFSIWFWDCNDGRLLKQVRKTSNFVTCLCLLPGNKIAINTYLDGIKILNIHDGSECHSIKTNEVVYSLAHLPSGHLITGALSNLKIYDPNTGECLEKIPIFDYHFSGFVMQISVSIDGNYLFALTDSMSLSVLALKYS